MSNHSDWAAAYQALSIARAARRGQVWTVREVERLQELRQAGQSVTECAAGLERTFYGTSTMLSLISRGDWTPGADRIVSNLRVPSTYRGWMEGDGDGTGLPARLRQATR